MTIMSHKKSNSCHKADVRFTRSITASMRVWASGRSRACGQASPWYFRSRMRCNARTL